MLHNLFAFIEYRKKISSNEIGFAELASQMSDCSSARNGGDLGWFGPGQMQSKQSLSQFNANFRYTEFYNFFFPLYKNRYG